MPERTVLLKGFHMFCEASGNLIIPAREHPSNRGLLLNCNSTPSFGTYRLIDGYSYKSACVE